ncbi:hypothetical protein DUU79_19105 [Salmonella enterica subsp. enterica serovar Goldcoast]|nr:hypothetical protein [Salmonella enterica subsp. enterica serovar Goldcoast]EBY1294632.1 hypothetical protein [Salmonella enterica subsp. enterica serovar Goldcoast]
MMSLWDALRMNMMISYQELVRTFPSTSLFSRSRIKMAQFSYRRHTAGIRQAYLHAGREVTTISFRMQDTFSVPRRHLGTGRNHLHAGQTYTTSCGPRADPDSLPRLPALTSESIKRNPELPGSCADQLAFSPWLCRWLLSAS